MNSKNTNPTSNLESVIPSSPKLRNGNLFSNSELYRYYAGYSDFFVKEQLIWIEQKLGKKGIIVIDPWNGSGTTTFVSSILGYSCYGFDINPVMVLVSKAKLYCANFLEINKLINFIDHNKPLYKDSLIKSNDPLCSWFTSKTVGYIRYIEKMIRKICNIDTTIPLKSIFSYDEVSPQLAFYYVVLFELLRKYTSIFSGTNPTWIKAKIDEELKLNISFPTLYSDYISLIKESAKLLISKVDIDLCKIDIGNSKHINLSDNSVDCIITSPPYCTRIDYAVYTRIELALLGFSVKEFDFLRRKMIGTPTISHSHINYDIYKGKPYENILTKIEKHDSKAAKGYYLKTYYQYFYQMEESIRELSRITRIGGIATFVIQDSWFKDIYIDLPTLICSIMEQYGFKICHIDKIKVTNNMRYMNTKSNLYRKSNKSYESVIILERV